MGDWDNINVRNPQLYLSSKFIDVEVLKPNKTPTYRNKISFYNDDDDDDDKKKEELIICEEVTSVTKGVSWSKGALLHAAGNCRPCAFYWKPDGYNNHENCTFCHMCDQDAL